MTDEMKEAIRSLQGEAYLTAANSGFHTPRIQPGESHPREASTLERLMLIDTETAEAAEEIRDGVDLTVTRWVEKADGPPKPEGFGIELADAVIRILDTAESTGVDLAWCLEVKMAYNAAREYMHGRVI